MKKIIKNKKIGIILIIIGLLLFALSFLFNKKDKITMMEEAIEHVFFYLPYDEYDDLNNISDYCKISLIYDTDYLKNDVYLSKDDYDTITNSKRNSVFGYKKDNVLKAIQSVLGKNIKINFEKNEDDDYEFLLEDKCKYGNKKINTLSYNKSGGYIYSIDEDEEDNSKLYVKWDDPIYNGDTVTLKAYALLAIKNNSGGYDIYLDNNLSNKIDTITSNISYKIAKLYDQSYIYEFTLKKENNNYIWTNYKITNKFDDTVIYD